MSKLPRKQKKENSKPTASKSAKFILDSNDEDKGTTSSGPRDLTLDNHERLNGHMDYKVDVVHETETHIVFPDNTHNGNLYAFLCPRFKHQIKDDEVLRGYEFQSAEHLRQYLDALVIYKYEVGKRRGAAANTPTYDQIPPAVITHGRKSKQINLWLKDFDWESHPVASDVRRRACWGVLYRLTRAKFHGPYADQVLKTALLNTGEKILVFASESDSKIGIGCSVKQVA